MSPAFLSAVGWTLSIAVVAGTFLLAGCLIFFAFSRSYCPHIRIGIRERARNLVYGVGFGVGCWQVGQYLSFW